MKSAFFLNGGFAIIEFIGGIYTNSTAILSDAIHDLGDAAAIGTAIYFEKIAGKRKDKKFSYGYKRYSPLAALINTLILLVGSAIVLYNAIPRIFAPQPLNTTGMVILAIVGVAFNGIAVLRLKKEESTLSKRAIMLHLMEDLLGWIAVLVGSFVIKFTGWTVIDPIMSLLITCYILYNVGGNLRALFKIFMQSVPDNISEDEVREALKKLTDVVDVHDIHLWTMDGNYNIATLHVVVKNTLSASEQISLKQRVVDVLEELDINHVTTEIEFEMEEHCHNCDSALS
jgi:cation diffusion facilitator family transporter